MCGIAGYLNLRNHEPPSEGVLRLMLGLIRHRGPDQFGIYLDDRAGLGSARLSILDLGGGQQPIGTTDRRYWIVYNGEVFNHAELRAELVGDGVRFETRCDTEVVLNWYAREGPACLERFNGQFAFAIWDSLRRELFIARDRVGVRPLHYTVCNGQFIFGSEIKAMAAHPAVSLELDPIALGEVFTIWSCQPPRTAFRNVHQLPAGHFAIVSEEGGVQVNEWWRPSFVDGAGILADESGPARELGICPPLLPDGGGRVEPDGVVPTEEAEQLDELEVRLKDATRLRLLADVPVGAYLSGGLDSSLVAALAKEIAGDHLDTFSIAFADADYDERLHQERMARHLGTTHQVLEATHRDIGEAFPDVVWHSETPLLRTAPVPMYLLSRVVRRSGYKVVLTGEGADEFFAGYDLFKEAKIRAFWARLPGSKQRPKLFQRIYPDLQNLSRLGPGYLASFFGERLEDTGAYDYSHLTRWRNTRRAQRFFSAEVKNHINRQGNTLASAGISSSGRDSAGVLDRAQLLEIRTFLSTYLLSSQGDRVGMANSIEGRYPFLDPRMMDFALRLPEGLRMPALRDKFLLRKLGGRYLPADIWSRPKRPYRAPIHRCFFHPAAPDYVTELLSSSALEDAGWFDPAAVSRLVAKIEAGQPVGETDDMALAGILSTQILHSSFCGKDRRTSSPLSDSDDVKVCDRRTPPGSA